MKLTVSSVSPSILDDFFAVIRDCHNQRAEHPEYNRLTFALIGVSTPSDLIQDKRRTPFNIGRAIDLTGFQVVEAEPLARGLAAVGNPQELMQAVLNWTEGQPFLTQKVSGFTQKLPKSLIYRTAFSARGFRQRAASRREDAKNAENS